jgi:hypothetical protein
MKEKNKIKSQTIYKIKKSINKPTKIKISKIPIAKSKSQNPNRKKN